MSRGYITLAQNSGDTNYLEMAYALALSLKMTQSEVFNLTVVVTPGQKILDKYKPIFDHIIEVPDEDSDANETWKLKNKFKYLHISHYDETVVLDADMLFFQDVSHWWDIMAQQDMWFCTNPLNYKGNPIVGNYYRKVFEKNNLPDIYTAFMYFKKTQMSYEVFHMVEMITHNWTKFEFEFLSAERPKHFSGDVAFALALRLTGHEYEAINNNLQIPKFIHMKSRIQGWPHPIELTAEDWTRYTTPTFTPDLECKIGGYKIVDPLHYHVKGFLTKEIVKYYEKAHFYAENT